MVDFLKVIIAVNSSHGLFWLVVMILETWSSWIFIIVVVNESYKNVSKITTQKFKVKFYMIVERRNIMDNYFQTELKGETKFSSLLDLTLLITTGHFRSAHLKKMTKYLTSHELRVSLYVPSPKHKKKGSKPN